MRNNYEEKIDKWLKGLTLDILKKMSMIIEDIGEEWKLQGRNTFNPHLKFGQRVYDTQEYDYADIKPILVGLDRYRVIRVFKKLDSKTISIKKDPDIAREEISEITIFPYEFKYLITKLKEVIEAKEKGLLNEAYIELEKPTEHWNKETGIWTVSIPGEKDIKIKLGNKSTETNETFDTLHSMGNKDVRGSEVRDRLVKITGKEHRAINVGSSISTLRKWIKKGLTKKHEHLVSIRHDKSTKTYKLELNF